jgi:hypothetical protein
VGVRSSDDGGVAMSEYEKAIREERKALEEKRIALEAFFDTGMFDGLDEAEKHRLRIQAQVMQIYSDILEQRIMAIR